MKAPLNVISVREFFKTAAAVAGFCGSLISICAVLLAASEYFFHFSVFYDESNVLQSAYYANIVPVLSFGEQYVFDNYKDLKKNDPTIFKSTLNDFVAKNALAGRLTTAADIAEQIISCHQSVTCRFSAYASFRDPIRRLWFDFSPAILAMRGSTAPANFAVKLQQEAMLIYQEHQNENKAN